MSVPEIVHRIVIDKKGRFNTSQIKNRVDAIRPGVDLSSVSHALRRMARNGEITLVKSGFGNNPSVYCIKEEGT